MIYSTNLIIFLNLHNAFSLSSSLIAPIVSFLNNVFQIFGMKDKDGNAVDVKDVVGDPLENILKKLLGTESTEELLLFLTKANRIIQTGSNVLYDLQGLTDSVRSIGQQTGEYVAKIGNALKRNRIVPDDPEDSYQWTKTFHLPALFRNVLKAFLRILAMRLILWVVLSLLRPR